MHIKKQQLELDMEKQTGSKLGKEYFQSCILSSCLFNLYTEYVMWNAGLDKAIKIAERNVNNLRYADDPLWQIAEELKSLLMKVKEKGEKAGLKFHIQKMKIMPSGRNTSWQIDEETMQTVRDFIFWEITADGDCSHEIKRCFSLEEKVWQTWTAY